MKRWRVVESWEGWCRLRGPDGLQGRFPCVVKVEQQFIETFGEDLAGKTRILAQVEATEPHELDPFQGVPVHVRLDDGREMKAILNGTQLMPAGTLEFPK